MAKRYQSRQCDNYEATISFTLNSLINMCCFLVHRKVKNGKACGVMGSYVILAETISWSGTLTSWSHSIACLAMKTRLRQLMLGFPKCHTIPLNMYDTAVI